MIEDFSTLMIPGTLGFYESAEVTQLFLRNKKDNSIVNFYILIVLEEKPFISHDQAYLTPNQIKVNAKWDLGIQRYWLSLSETENTFKSLQEDNIWSMNGDNSLVIEKLRLLPKQFIVSTDGQRMHYALKNGFTSSYVLEFFDDKKTQTQFISNIENIRLLNAVNEKIKEFTRLDLSVAKDRIGNILFQFPINVVHVDSRAIKEWDGVELDFAWHPSISPKPECTVLVESVLDKNIMGSELIRYNGENSQTVHSGNIDQITKIQVWRNNPNLLLSHFNGTFAKKFNFKFQMPIEEPRIFKIEGEEIHVKLRSMDDSRANPSIDYTKYISAAVYAEEKDELEKSLSFKQYRNGDTLAALDDIRYLIQHNDEHGVYLWDPFLRMDDIIKTLFFSVTADVPLRGVGSISPNTKNVFSDEKGQNPADIIKEQTSIFSKISSNDYRLNMEFRMQYKQHGWAFHDRFLIFPGGEDVEPKVYSLGTSVNSLGRTHHILMKISHPQRVIDAFDELWEKLNKPNCIVWSSVKK